jgi:uncharacterized RDD family membrane protein YckC
MIESGDGWFVADQDGSAQGPLSRAQLQSLRDSGRIGDEHLVWTLRESEWVPLKRALGLRSTAPSAQPSPKPPPQESSRAASERQAAAQVKARANPRPPLPGTAPVRPAVDGRQAAGKQAPRAVAEALLTAAKADGLAEKRERASVALRRFVARSIDLVVLGGIGWALLSAIGLRFGIWELGDPQLELENLALFVPALLALATLPLEALLVGSLGYTPGRLLLGLRVVDRKGSAPGISLGFQRAGRVALIGQALLIAPFNLFAYGIAFATLVKNGRTHWDQALNLQVQAKPISTNQWWVALAALGVAWALWLDGFWMRLAHELLLRL